MAAEAIMVRYCPLTGVILLSPLGLLHFVWPDSLLILFVLTLIVFERVI